MRAFLFPGQGSQSVGMGAALSQASRAASDVFGEVAQKHLGNADLKRVFPGYSASAANFRGVLA